MTNWVEYWDINRQIVTIVGSYVPIKGELVKIKLKNKFKFREVIEVIHEIDKTDTIQERFKVFIK